MENKLTIKNLHSISKIFNEYQDRIEVAGEMVSEIYMSVDTTTGVIRTGINGYKSERVTELKYWNEEVIKGVIRITNNMYAKYAIKMIYDYGWDVSVIKRKNDCGEMYTGFKIFDKEYVDYIEIDVKTFYAYCVRDYLTQDLRKEHFNNLISRRCY